MKDIDEFQRLTLETAVYPGVDQGSREAVEYTVVGMASEAGEALGMIQKLKRGDFGTTDYPGATQINGFTGKPFPGAETIPATGFWDPELHRRLRDELGDVIWYWVRACAELDLDASEVIQANIEKLRDRHTRGVIQGAGNDR